MSERSRGDNLKNTRPILQQALAEFLSVNVLEGASVPTTTDERKAQDLRAMLKQIRQQLDKLS